MKNTKRLSTATPAPRRFIPPPLLEIPPSPEDDDEPVEVQPEKRARSEAKDPPMSAEVAPLYHYIVQEREDMPFSEQITDWLKSFEPKGPQRCGPLNGSRLLKRADFHLSKLDKPKKKHTCFFCTATGTCGWQIMAAGIVLGHADDICAQASQLMLALLAWERRLRDLRAGTILPLDFDSKVARVAAAEENLAAIKKLLNLQ